MANCLDNIVSFRGKCDQTPPTSGMYLDQIFMHKQELEQYFTTPYQNVDEFFNDQLNITINDIQNSIYTHFLPTYRSTSVINNDRLGYALDNMPLKTGSTNVNRGTEIEICAHKSGLEFYLSEFSLFLTSTADVLVKVYDLNQNKMIDSFTVSCVANQRTTIYPNKTYQAERRKLNLAFVYDSTLYDSIETRVNDIGCSSCSGNSNYSIINSFVSARGIGVDDSDDMVLENVETLDHTSGMSMIYSVNCNHKDWICSVGNLLVTPILYRLAFNIVTYGLYCDRSNHRTLDKVADMEKRAAFYDFKYSESMKSILNSIQPPKDGLCYECNSRIKTRFSFS